MKSMEKKTIQNAARKTFFSFSNCNLIMDGTVTYRRPPSEGKFNVIECIYNRIQFKAEIKNFLLK
jgi:hypothetical protein